MYITSSLHRQPLINKQYIPLALGVRVGVSVGYVTFFVTVPT